MEGGVGFGVGVGEAGDWSSCISRGRGIEQGRVKKY